ncbi:hypothetical protein [Bremerella cremea]|uniref:hypothetical protein n=1 Tax=Bremerella cremea TaxID=1031537 RepID=UPI0031F118EE
MADAGVRMTPRWVWAYMVGGVLLSIAADYETLDFALDFSPLAGLIFVSRVVLLGIAAGLGLAVGLFAAGKKQFAALQPGHWLLLISLLDSLANFLTEGAFLLANLVPDMTKQTAIILLNVPDFLAYSLQVLLVLWLLKSTHERGYWKWFILLVLLQIGSQLFFSVLLFTPSIASDFFVTEPTNPIHWLLRQIHSSDYLIGAALAVLMLVGIARDTYWSVPRDRYHYLGLVIPICLALLVLAANNLV